MVALSVEISPKTSSHLGPEPSNFADASATNPATKRSKPSSEGAMTSPTILHRRPFSVFLSVSMAVNSSFQVALLTIAAGMSSSMPLFQKSVYGVVESPDIGVYHLSFTPVFYSRSLAVESHRIAC